jgi:integrase/recombinase XerD
VRTRAGADFASLVQAFLEELRVRRFSESSLQKARYELPPLFLHLRDEGIRDVRAVDEAHLAGYARKLATATSRRGTPLSPSSRASLLTTARRFFAFLLRRELILQDPARSLPLPKLDHLPRGILSESQARRLMAAPFPGSVFGLRDRAILELVYGTGIRLGEATRADLTDLDLGQGTLLVRSGKGKKDRVVPVPGRALLALQTYLREARPLLVQRSESALFLSRAGGGRLGGPGIRQVIWTHSRRLGFRAAPHSLRHTCATHLLRGGADVRQVQQLLGHRRLDTTALYTRVVVEDLRAVIRRCHPRERFRR